MKKVIYILLAVFIFIGCQNDNENFDNFLKIDASSMKTDILLKGNSPKPVTMTLQVRTPKPVESIVQVRFAVNESLVETFNQAYYSQAELLPLECYSIPVDETVINAGSTNSLDINIEFLNLEKLEYEKDYVLPVTVLSDNIHILESAKTMYYYFSHGTLINTVADMKGNYFEVPEFSSGVDDMINMKQLTMEFLMYPRSFNWLQGLMGTTYENLIRLNSNVLEVYGRAGGIFLDTPRISLETEKWYHVALTFDGDKDELKIYVNGDLYRSGSLGQNDVSFVNPPQGYKFWIGADYETTRNFDGYMSECRIWNVIRTPEEIKNNAYYVEENTPGLIGYWKLDDNSDTTLKDYSVNGNNAKAGKSVKWFSVQLPSK